MSSIVWYGVEWFVLTNAEASQRAPLASFLMLTRYQSHMKKSWTFVENLGIVWEKEADMAHAFPPVTSRIDSRSRFGVTEFEPLLNSEQAADLLQIHHKTLQKLARRGEIRGTHIGKLWRFRASDLNEWFNRSERAAS